jgi:hypothetical protein
LEVEQIATFLSFDQSQERAIYHFNNALPAGSKAEFRIAYAGKLTANMMGYYKSAWENKGKTEHYALTQFEVGILSFCMSFLISHFPGYRCSTRVSLLG